MFKKKKMLVYIFKWLESILKFSHSSNKYFPIVIYNLCYISGYYIFKNYKNISFFFYLRY